MPRGKHRRDGNHGRNGWVGGNPRYAGKGFKKGDRRKSNASFAKDLPNRMPAKD